MVFLLYIYIRTDPITLPCSLARAGNKGVYILLYLHVVATTFISMDVPNKGVDNILRCWGSGEVKLVCEYNRGVLVWTSTSHS